MTRLQAGPIAGVALELGPGTRREVPTIGTALAGSSTPMLLRFALREGLGLRDVPGLHQRLSLLRISSRELDSLAADVSAILTPALPAQPRLLILSRMESLLSGQAMRVVITAAIAGRRAITVPELAVLCDVSVRTLEVRCHEAGILSPKPLLAWVLALHATWWVTRCGWSLSKVVQVMGLASEIALTSRVARTTGQRLAGTRHGLDFDELLDRFEAAMAKRGGGSWVRGLSV